MRIGDHVGCYRLVCLLAKGGMGAVYEACNDRLERRVAVKFLHPALAHDPEHNRRFLDEARIVNLISHPGLVTIHDYGTLADGCAYIVMEYLDGQTLAQRLQAHGERPLPFDQAVRIARQVAAALAAAHDKDVVHRDLKPDNLIIITDLESAGGERIKILDFGIAKVKRSARLFSEMTQAGVAMGTPGYIAPEQIFGASSVDGRADVYSLGVILYEMIGGCRPFRCASGDQEMKFHLTMVVPPLLERMPSTPPAIAELVHAMLAKEPKARPTMREVTERLRAFELYAPSTQFIGQSAPRPAPRLTMTGIALAALLFGGLLLFTRLPAGNRSALPRKLDAPRLVIGRVDAGAMRPEPPPRSLETTNMGVLSIDGGAVRAPTNLALPKDRTPRSKHVVRFQLDENANFPLK